MRSALDEFHRCARRLGILGFDLSEKETRLGDHQRLAIAPYCTSDTTARLKVDFAVFDEEANPSVHAVLESAHPDSIAIFKFDQDARPETAAARLASLPKFQ